MSKIILRDKQTAKTREVDAAKWEALPQADKDEILAVADMFPVADPAMQEAEAMAGLGDEGPGLLESGLHGATAGLLGEAPTTLGGVAAEAAGSGLRDAVLAGLAARLGSPRLAGAVPSIVGAAEGAVTTPGGPAEKTGGAAVGAIAPLLPVPGIGAAKKTASQFVDPLAEWLGKRTVAKTKEQIKEGSFEAAEEAARKFKARQSAANEDIKAAQVLEEETIKAQKALQKPGYELMPPAQKQKILEEDLALQTAKERAEATTKRLKGEQKELEAAEKLKEKAAAELQEKAAEAQKRITDAGTAATEAGVRGASGSLISQTAREAAVAIMADPRLKGRELSSITPTEMARALARAFQMLTDPQERARNLAIAAEEQRAKKE
jgi:hypothetical protein